MLLHVYVRLKKSILNMEWEVANGRSDVRETKTGLLHLQERCIQRRICQITEDTLEFLSFLYMSVECTG